MHSTTVEYITVKHCIALYRAIHYNAIIHIGHIKYRYNTYLGIRLFLAVQNSIE